MGAAYGTAKSGVGIAAVGVLRPELIMRSIIPTVMAGSSRYYYYYYYYYLLFLLFCIQL